MEIAILFGVFAVLLIVGVPIAFAISAATLATVVYLGLPPVVVVQQVSSGFNKISLLAIPLSFVNPRAGRTNNLILAVLVYLIYSNAVSVCQAWVGQGRLRFDVGLWIPHLAMLGVLAILFYRRISVFARWRRR